MLENLLNLIEEKSPGAKPLLLVIRGSHAYGTNIETSDIDFGGVYIQNIEDILGNKYKEQINDDKNDIVIYELKRFLELVSSNNPNILELLHTPDDCILYKDPAFDVILEKKDDFITKKCAHSFGGYAHAQIKKARGTNKKQNWEEEKMTRKDVLDFVYVIKGEKSIPWKKWNVDKEDPSGKIFNEKFCGITNVPNVKDVYSLFYDFNSSWCYDDTLSKEEQNNRVKTLKNGGLGYKGLVKVGEGQNLAESNQLRLSSIPKGEEPRFNIFYNKDGYSEHCKKFKEYTEWLENRNLQRFVDVKSQGQKIDGKNMMHCVRLIQMAKEIAEGKGICVRRNNKDELLSIRRGEVDLQTILERVETDIQDVFKLFEESTIKDNVDDEMINDLIVNIRKKIYNL